MDFIILWLFLANLAAAAGWLLYLGLKQLTPACHRERACSAERESSFVHSALARGALARRLSLSLSHTHDREFLLYCTAHHDGARSTAGPIDERAQSGTVFAGFSEFLGVQSKCQSNFNYGSENIWLEMEFVSKVIKKQCFLRIFAASILSILKLNDLHRKLGKKTFRFKVLKKCFSSFSFVATVAL